MKKEKPLLEKKKGLLLALMWVGWFFPCTYIDIYSYNQEQLIQAIIAIGVMVISTALYHLLSNTILRIIVLSVSVVASFLGLEIDVALLVCSAMLLLFAYTLWNSKKDSRAFEKTISRIFLIIAPVLSAICIVLNLNIFEEKAEFLFKSVFWTLVFISTMIFTSRSDYMKKTAKSKKAEIVFAFVAIITGLVASISLFASVLSSAVAFFPWFFISTVLVFEEDEILISTATMLTNRTKKFLDIKIKRGN